MRLLGHVLVPVSRSIDPETGDGGWRCVRPGCGERFEGLPDEPCEAAA